MTRCLPVVGTRVCKCDYLVSSHFILVYLLFPSTTFAASTLRSSSGLCVTSFGINTDRAANDNAVMPNKCTKLQFILSLTAKCSD